MSAAKSGAKPLDLGLKTAYDELFMGDQGRAENRLPKIYNIPLSEIDDFPDHPYQVRMDEDMTQLVESIKERGVITPVTLRKKEDGRYTALYRGYRLLAADGSDLAISPNPSDYDSYYPGANGQKHYSLLHLNALYDLQQKTYVDALVQKSRKTNEQRALCDMVDRSHIPNAILLADRGYEGYNSLAHIQEKGWKFLFRIKDNACGIAAGLTLPKSCAFDVAFSLKLSNKQSNEAKLLYKDSNHYKCLCNGKPFDFLPSTSRKADPMLFYELSFRIVRFKISEDSYETVITNLDYSPDELKQLYAMRWGIETSFRDLKYTVGLSAFHSKKVEHILQEIFARLTMYNFAERITACVVIRRGCKKHAYQANFSAAVHICREFLRGNVHPPDVEALLARFISPVRPDRKHTRKLSPKGFVSFLYRVA